MYVYIIYECAGICVCTCVCIYVNICLHTHHTHIHIYTDLFRLKSKALFTMNRLKPLIQNITVSGYISIQGANIRIHISPCPPCLTQQKGEPSGDQECVGMAELSFFFFQSPRGESSLGDAGFLLEGQRTRNVPFLQYAKEELLSRDLSWLHLIV